MATHGHRLIKIADKFVESNREAFPGMACSVPSCEGERLYSAHWEQDVVRYGERRVRQMRGYCEARARLFAKRHSLEMPEKASP
jgi:hypothetical protein